MLVAYKTRKHNPDLSEQIVAEVKIVADVEIVVGVKTVAARKINMKALQAVHGLEE